MASTLEIKDLYVSIEDKEILKGVNLTINTDEIHAIMGPNRTGKSTLSSAIMGHPSYEVTKGEVLLDGVNILELEVDERAKQDYSWQCNIHQKLQVLQMLISCVQQSMRNVKKDKKST